MLEPESRLTLLDALRPPPGHRLDFAVGTTFSMSLDALLTAPAAFALFDVGDTRAPGDVEPIELLDSIRRHADRMLVFCQAGQISVPAQRRLFTYLERTVVPVKAPLEGVFHPKCWALRFVDGETEQVRYRILCASRNLTFDRSWDTLLRIDSHDGDSNVVDMSGFAELIQALPAMAVIGMEEEQRARVAELAYEIANAAFVPPPGFDRVQFLPFGLNPVDPPFPARCDRMLVISPFLTPWALDRLPKTKSSAAILSRTEALDATPLETLSRFDLQFVLDPNASPTLETTTADNVKPTDDPGVDLQGLHAKLYVFENADEVTVLTGSANATGAAFKSNVELLAELVSTSDKMRVGALLDTAEDSEASLLRLLLPYLRTNDEATDLRDPIADRLDHLRREFGEVPLVADVTPATDDTFTVRYTSSFALPKLPDGVTARMWPVTLRSTDGRVVDGGVPLDLDVTVSFEAMTAFIAVQLTDGDITTEGVMRAELHNAPSDRDSRLLRLLLGDASRFLRYLLLLLADETSDQFELSELLDRLDADKDTDGAPQVPTVPLLEALLRALRKEPKRLEHVERLVVDLAGEVDILPAHFAEIWEPVWAVAQEQKR